MKGGLGGGRDRISRTDRAGGQTLCCFTYEAGAPFARAALDAEAWNCLIGGRLRFIPVTEEPVPDLPF